MVRWVAALSLLLAACVTGPEPTRTCGDYPFVLVTGSSWVAEEGADWLLSQPDDFWPLYDRSFAQVGFFEPGLSVSVQRESDRFPVLVKVRYREDAMWTHREETAC